MTVAERTAEVGAGELWWTQPFRMFQTNIREIDAGLDVERVLGQIVEYGADAWLISAGGIISNYPTRLAHQSRNPALAQRQSGDLLGDAVAAAHRRGVKVLCRMDFSKIARPVAEAHPEWAYVAPDGSRQVYQGLTSVCPNGGYYQEKLFEVLAEILGAYEVDGFFFNWMSFNEVDYEKRYRGVCQCVACHTAFAGPLGQLPSEPDSPGYRTWQGMAQAVLDDLLARAREFISARRPQAPLVMGDTADIVFHEANNAIGRPLWPHQTSEHVSAARAYRPDVPVLVNAVAFLDMPYRMVSEEPRLFEQYLLQAVARGAMPSTYIMGTPDEFPYASLPAGSRIVRFHRDHQDVYTRLAPAARTALVRPDPLKKGAPLYAESAPAHAEQEFRGVWTALLERHVPFDALPERRLAELGASGALDRYALLVLPDLGTLDEHVVAALDAFVHRGGRLLLTGASGLDAERGQLASGGVEARLVTMDTCETTWSSAVVTPDGSPLPILGAFHVVRPRAGATSRMSVLSRAPYGPPEKCYGHLPLDHPALLEHRHGRGRTITVPWTPGRAFREVGLSGLARVVGDAAVELLGPDLEVTTDLPAQVEVAVGRSEAGYVVHLRNLTGLRHQSFGDPVAVPAGHLMTIRGVDPSRVPRALVVVDELATERASDGITVVLPEIGLFEVVVLPS